LFENRIIVYKYFGRNSSKIEILIDLFRILFWQLIYYTANILFRRSIFNYFSLVNHFDSIDKSTRNKIFIFYFFRPAKYRIFCQILNILLSYDLQKYAAKFLLGCIIFILENSVKKIFLNTKLPNY